MKTDRCYHRNLKVTWLWFNNLVSCKWRVFCKVIFSWGRIQPLPNIFFLQIDVLLIFFEERSLIGWGQQPPPKMKIIKIVNLFTHPPRYSPVILWVYKVSKIFVDMVHTILWLGRLSTLSWDFIWKIVKSWCCKTRQWGEKI